jgi:hypothetical protein
VDWNKAVLLSLSLLILAASAQAQLLVSLNPKQPLEALYPFETADFELAVYNSSQTALEDYTFKVSTTQELILVDNGREVTDLTFEFDSIEPGQTLKENIKVKALDVSSRQNYITVNHGQQVFLYSSSTWLDIVENPVKITVRIDRSSMNPGEENTVFLDLENNGQAILSDVEVDLLLPEKFELMSRPTISDVLSPGQSTINSQFVFKPSEAVSGRQTVTLRISYREEEAVHVIEKSFDLDVGEREQLLYILIGVVLGLIVVSYLLSRKKPRKSAKEAEKTQAKPEKKPAGKK